jgi:phosphoserine phosphatase
MQTVVTLIGAPVSDGLPASLARKVAEALPGAPRPVWLADDLACDLSCADANPAAIGTLVDAALDGAPVDCVVQPVAGRRKRLLIADMDSTIIEQECIDELADAVGLRDRVSAITERAMRGEIAFEPALRERVALLKGLNRDALARVYENRIRLRPGARQLVTTMRAHGAYAALVSGGFTFFTERIAEAAGFDESRANILEFEGDRLAGTVREPIQSRQAKLDTLEELTRRLAIDRSLTLAVGDGANDLAMITAAGLGVAFHAKPAVAAAAHARIDHGDLEALLYVQGYHAGEIVG